MKLSGKHKVIILVTFLILTLSFGLSIANYWSAFEQTRKQLKENSLPLSTDNIYSDIQKIIIEPSLISSVMASDTFVHDWFKTEDQNPEKIVKYLSAITQKYKFSHTFLVSSHTKNYYTNDGFLEPLSLNKKDNMWYFRFINTPHSSEINIDNNELLDNNLLLFFNYKILGENKDLLGVTGVVFKTSYISEMFKRFKQYYKLKVFLMDKKGNIVLSEQGINNSKKLAEKAKMQTLLPEVLRHKSTILDLDYNSKNYIIKSKYITELNLYLIVQAELDQFTEKDRDHLIVNIIIALIITGIIILIILRTFMSYTKQLSELANHDALTQLPNRRTFNESFKLIWKQYQQNKCTACLALFDIDNFKKINDTLGHPTGDKVLQQIADLLTSHIRNTDYISRWGGEEFSILLINTNTYNAKIIVEKFRSTLENDPKLQEITGGTVTASFGLTSFSNGNSIKDITTLADNALYKAKIAGKNCVKMSTEL